MLVLGSNNLKVLDYKPQLPSVSAAFLLRGCFVAEVCDLGP